VSRNCLPRELCRPDEEGRFEISFTPQRPDTHLSVRSFCSFVVDASVTDLNGETQTGSYTVPVGDASLFLSLEMSDRWEKGSGEKVMITTKNLDGNEVFASGSYRIYSLQENDSLNRLVGEGFFETGEQVELAKRLTTLPLRQVPGDVWRRRTNKAIPWRRRKM